MNELRDLPDALRTASAASARAATPQTKPAPMPPPRTAVELCRWFKLKPAARPLLNPELTPQQFFAILMENKLYADARRVLAHALPKRRAVWWGCLCVWEALRSENLTPAEYSALEATMRWVVRPSEQERRAAEAAGWAAKPTTLPGCLAMAAYLSDGSMSKAGLPYVPTKPFLTGRLVGVAVYLASVRKQPANYLSRLRQFLEMGKEIARGRNLWTDAEFLALMERTPGSGLTPALPIPAAKASADWAIGSADEGCLELS